MHRRDLIRLGAAAAAAALNPALLAAVPPAKPGAAPSQSVEQWSMFELSLPGPSGGNPYKEITLAAVFTLEHRSVHVTGFYDGDGTYLLRFMPDAPGRWSY